MRSFQSSKLALVAAVSTSFALAVAVAWAGGLSADLSITKTDGAASSIPGNNVVYTIVATNAGPSDVVGATVTDTFPASLTCTWTCTASPGSSCTAAGAGNISDSADLLNSGTATYTATCSIDAAATGSLANTASIASALSDPNMGNNSATDTNSLTPEADLSVTKTDSADPVLQGAAFSYTITVDNAGPSDATGVSISDVLPPGVTLVSTSGCAEDPNGAPTCTLGTIAASGMASYTINATAPNAAGMISNTATVSAATTDPNSGNDSDTETTDISALSADLSVTKIASAGSVAEGSPFSYLITVTNAGPDDATNVAVTDILPAGMTFVSTSGCAEDPSGVPTCTLGTVANGAMASYTIDVLAPDTPGMHNNTATVTASESDPNGGDDSSTEGVDVSPGGAGAVPIPTANEWALILLTLMLVSSALWRLR